jgi:ferredoxin
VGEAPELFGIERIEGVDKVVLKVALAPPDLRTKLELAIEHCPTHALSIEKG